MLWGEPILPLPLLPSDEWEWAIMTYLPRVTLLCHLTLLCRFTHPHQPSGSIFYRNHRQRHLLLMRLCYPTCSSQMSFPEICCLSMNRQLRRIVMFRRMIC